MKKRVAAVVLSITLCMTTVLQTGAAVFDDQSDAAMTTSFDASFTDAESGEMSIPEAPAIPDEVTPVPTETVPTPTETVPTPEIPGDIVTEPEAPANSAVPSETPAEETPDVDVFSAGENTEPQTNTPEETVEGEVLTAADGKIYISNWVSVDGKWKLRKPASTTLKAADTTASSLEVPGEAAFAEEIPAEADVVQAAFVEGTDSVPAEGSAQMEESVPTEEPVSEGEAAPLDETAPADEDSLNRAASTEYYTAEDGIVHIQTYQSVGQPNNMITEGDYFFDNQGFLITGTRIVPEKTPGTKYDKDHEHYFMTKENATLLNPNSSAECTPVNSNMGQMQKKYWLWDGKRFSYFSSNGGYLGVQSLERIQSEAGTYTGYQIINGNWYFLENDGTPKTGFVTVTKGTKPGKYYASPAKKAGEIPGKVFKNGWMSLKDSKGTIQWHKFLSDGRYYEHGIMAANLKGGDGKTYTYLVSAQGYILKGTMAKAQTGYYYITNSIGRVYKNRLVTYKGARYYVTAGGKVSTWKNSWHRVAPAGNRYYYFGSTAGKIVEKHGWQRVVNPNNNAAGWFFFSSKGNHFINILTGDRYYRPDGRLASGITTVNGKTYFFQGSTTTTPKGKMYKNTWISYKNKWYYAGSNGELYKNGWKYIKNGYYYFNSDYTVKTNQAVTKNGVKGYVDSTGRFLSGGWVIVNNAKNQVQYVDPSTGQLLKNTSKVISGYKYYFDKNGYRINDLTGMYKGPYYLVADRINGVMTVFDSTRTVPLKSIRISVGLPGTPTWPTNKDMRLTSYSRWQALMGPSWGQYGTHVDGAGNGGIFIHSVAGLTQSYYNLPAGEYNRLGNPASHGCIRCCVADARWVFYNCNGSTIRIIDGTYNANEAMKGPLGRRALVPLYGSKNFDPTDNLAWH